MCDLRKRPCWGAVYRTGELMKRLAFAAILAIAPLGADADDGTRISIAYRDALYFCGYFDATNGTPSGHSKCTVELSERLEKAIANVTVSPQRFCSQVHDALKRMNIRIVNWKLEVRPSMSSNSVVTCPLHNPS